MDVELNKFGPNSRTSMLNKMKKYKLDVELIQKDLVIFRIKYDLYVESHWCIPYFIKLRKKQSMNRQNSAVMTIQIRIHL